MTRLNRKLNKPPKKIGLTSSDFGNEKPAVRYGRVLNRIKDELVRKGYDVEYIDIEELPKIIGVALPPKQKQEIRPTKWLISDGIHDCKVREK